MLNLFFAIHYITAMLKLKTLHFCAGITKALITFTNKYPFNLPPILIR